MMYEILCEQSQSAWESTYFEFEIFQSSILLDESRGSELVYLVLESVGMIKTQGSHKSLC